MFDPMFNDDPWRDAGIEADDDPQPLKPRHPWYEYAGLVVVPSPAPGGGGLGWGQRPLRQTGSR